MNSFLIKLVVKYYIGRFTEKIMRIEFLMAEIFNFSTFGKQTNKKLVIEV